MRQPRNVTWRSRALASRVPERRQSTKQQRSDATFLEHGAGEVAALEEDVAQPQSGEIASGGSNPAEARLGDLDPLGVTADNVTVDVAADQLLAVDEVVDVGVFEGGGAGAATGRRGAPGAPYPDMPVEDALRVVPGPMRPTPQASDAGWGRDDGLRASRVGASSQDHGTRSSDE